MIPKFRETTGWRQQKATSFRRLKTKYTYDDLLRVTAIEQVQDLASGLDYLLSKYQYTRRADGKIVQVSEQESTIGSATYENGRANFQYDPLGRLKQEKYRTEPTDPLFSQTTITDYTFDLVGNRKTKVTSGAATETVTNTYDNRDRLLTETSSVSGQTTYGYNTNGEQTSKNGGGENSTYTFDQRGHLVAAAVTRNGNTTNASYIYNEQGLRTRVTENGVQRLLLIDPNNPTGYAQVVEERDVSQGGIIVAAYVYGMEPILQMQRASEAIAWAAHWLLSEAHSGVRQMLDAGAIVREMYRYDAYGVQKLATHGLVNPVQYRGERFDGTLGQYYLRARFYDPASGRFTSSDRFRGILGSPRTHHKYAYCGNDSLNHIDPTGNMDIATATVLGVASSLVAQVVLNTFPQAVASLIRVILPASLPETLNNIASGNVTGYIAGAEATLTGQFGLGGGGNLEALISARDPSKIGVYGTIAAYWEFSGGNRSKFNASLEVYGGLLFGGKSFSDYGGITAGVELSFGLFRRVVGPVAAKRVFPYLAKAMSAVRSRLVGNASADITSLLLHIASKANENLFNLLSRISEASSDIPPILDNLAITVNWNPGILEPSDAISLTVGWDFSHLFPKYASTAMVTLSYGYTLGPKFINPETEL